MMKWVTIKKFARESGYTPNAIYQKKKNGIWAEGKHWIKSPDGRILINQKAVERWQTGIKA